MDKKLAVEFYKDEETNVDMFRIEGQVCPEVLNWEKNGNAIETAYLFTNASRGEGQLASFRNAPVWIKLKMTIPKPMKDGKLGDKRQSASLDEVLKGYQF